MKIKKVSAILLTIILAFGIFSETAFAEGEEFAFTEQPQNAEVTVPNGAMFHVGINKPEDQCEFQWYLMDSYGQEFMLDGTSARTSALYIPATEQNLGLCRVYCVVEYDGVSYTSAAAELNIINDDDPDAILYVGNYALLPGDSINLNCPDPERDDDPALGSGRIDFSSDGTTVTFDNVDFTNASFVYDTLTSPAIGIVYRAWNNTREKLYLELEGTNRVYNSFFQEETNGSGIPIDFYCLGETSVKPELVIEGDGTLEVTGGTYLIRNNGSITVNSDLVLKGLEDHFCDGIHTDGIDSIITVSEDVNIDADINGTGMFAQTGIDIKPGAVLDIRSGIPAVGAGDSSKNVLYGGVINIKGASVKIDMYYDPLRFDPPYSVGAAFTGISSTSNGIDIDDSEVEIEITAGKNESFDIYAYEAAGIRTSKDTDLKINNSKVGIKMDSADVLSGRGISCGGNLKITDSVVGSSIKALGYAYGIYVNHDIEITDSKVTAEADAYPLEDEFDKTEESRGILSNGGYIRVSANKDDSDLLVSASSADGIAFGSDYLSNFESSVDFDPEYEAQYIVLDDNCTIITPAGAKISSASRNNGYNKYYVTETVYDPADTSKAASKVVIEKKNNVKDPADIGDIGTGGTQQNSKNNSKSGQVKAASTGDHNNIPIFIVIMTAALLAVGAGILAEKKKNQIIFKL